MPLFDIVLIVLAGIGAGTINAIVGSGTLVTFPTLLVLGYPPLVANISNNIGLLPGGVAGAYGYRRELAGKSRLILRLLPWSIVGGLVGSILLLALPSSFFDAVVPLLVGFGLLLVILGPRLSASAAAHHATSQTPLRRALTPAAVLATGVYGGYFGAAQGIILVGLLSVLLTESLQEINGLKNVLVPLVNLTAAIIFIGLRWSQIDWWVAALIGVGSAIGGVIGSNLGRRLNPVALRAVILVVGLIALARLTVLR